MSKLSKLPNIGKVLEKQLNYAGIKTDEDLIDLGSKEAWLKIKEVDDSACLNRLMALEGAIQNIRWHDLSQEDKDNLNENHQLIIDCKQQLQDAWAKFQDNPLWMIPKENR